METSFMRRLLPTLSDSETALFKSQGGPLASALFVNIPWDRTCRLEPQPLSVLLLRRLRLPLSLTTRTCQCASRRRWPPSDFRWKMQPPGYVGRLGEGCAPTPSRDMDLGPINPLDARKLEDVVDRLDTTLVCPLTRDGAAKPRAATMSGACPETARRRKEACHPELVGIRAERALLSWLVKWVVVSRQKQLNSFGTSPTRRSVRYHGC